MPRSAPQPAPVPPPSRNVAVPAGERFAQSAGSYSADARTVEIVIATETLVRTPGWVLGLRDDFYYEVLDCSAGAVDLSQVEAGNCPLLDAHNPTSIDRQLGKVTGARFEAGTVVIKVALGQSTAARAAEAELAAGTAPKASAGYTRNEVQFDRMEGDSPVYRVTSWTLREASLVPIAADPKAGFRAPNCTLFPCNLTERNQQVPEEAPLSPPSAQANRAALVDTIRVSTDYLANFGFSAERRAALALDYVARGATAEEVSQDCMRLAAEGQRAAISAIRSNGIAFEGSAGPTFDNPAFQGRAIEEAIFCRLSGRAPAEGSAAREFMALSLPQIAAEMLSRAGVRDVHRMPPMELLESASWNRVGARAGWLAGRASPGVTTSDFPDLLQAAGQRYLLDRFTIAASALKTVARERQANDFRDIFALQTSNFDDLEVVPESGEIKHGYFRERKESYRVETFAKIFSMTLQAMINDDLGAFSTPLLAMATKAADKEATILADLVNGNPVLASDNKALFHVDHGNLAGVGGAPSVDTLDAGRLAMRSQKDTDGKTPIAAVPKYIVAAPKHETAIERLLAQITPAISDNVNPFAGKLEPQIDPRLSDNAWYLFADPAGAPVLEYAYLSSRPGPQLDMKEGWNVLGQEYRVVLHFGAGAVGYHGAYRNAGA